MLKREMVMEAMGPVALVMLVVTVLAVRVESPMLLVMDLVLAMVVLGVMARIGEFR